MTASKKLLGLALGAAIISGGFLAYAATSAPTPAVTAQAVSTQAVLNATNQILALGTFDGRSDHVTTGGASLVKTDTGYRLVLGANFELDGAPDPIIGFGNNDEFQLKISALSSKAGHQAYDLPAGFTPAQFNQVFVWCEKFDVPLGAANLTPAA